MANYIEESNFVGSRFSNLGSRYYNSKVIYYVINGSRKIAYEVYKKSSNLNSNKDVFMLIVPRYEYRPDLASLDAYGVVDYWWKILEVNNIKDIMEFKTGRTIRIPSNVI